MIRRPTPTTQPRTRRPWSRYGLLLALIVLAAAVLRFTGLDWDDGRYLHPDERFMVMVTVDTAWPETIGGYFDSETSPLNPYNTRHGTFVYGTFPVFLTKALGDLVGLDLYGNIHLVGRTLSALTDTGTVFLVAWIGRRFFGNKSGLLAGFLAAFTMLHIQSAHFYTVDAMSVFFATATFVTVVKGWERKSVPWFALAGVMAGFAGASKPNYLIALGFFALPVLETIRLHGIDGLFPTGRRRVFPVIPAVLLAGLVAFWTFRIGQPYAFAGPNIWNVGLNPQWTNDLSYWQAAQSGLIDIKAGIQWVGRTPILYIVENMVAWGMGPPLGIAALAALALGTWRVLRWPRWPSWWFLGMLGWSIAQLVLYGTNMAQAQRYLLPIYPFLIALAAGLLVEASARLRMANSPLRHDAPRRTPGTGRGATRFLGPALIAVTMLYTALYGVAFDTLYVRPLSRVQASEWIYENVPPGSTITSEYWDDALPIALEGEDAWAYNGIVLDLYGWEGPDSTKLSTLIGQLNAADYIVLSSNRIIGSVPRQPERYPMATHYYEMLLNGDLGFEMVAEFSQTPELFGISFDDRDAEETITVYEHPYVRIFQKTDAFDIEQVYAELDAAMGYGGINYLPGDPVGDQMFLSDAEWAETQENGTWSAIYDRENRVQDAPALWWYLGMQVLAVPAIPLAWLLFRRFPDGGYALAKPLGLLLVTWLAWLLSSTGTLGFGPLVIVIAWAGLTATGLLLARYQLGEMVTGLTARWRWILATEILFATAIAGMAWLRAHDAAFWTPGGADETPFYFAIFNAAARSPVFPPLDPWLAGGQVHYPYWGMMPWVLLTRLTGVMPTTAYTLAFAGIFALLIITLWTVAAALICRIGGVGRHAGWLALLAPVLGGVAGTLEIVARAGRGEWGFSPRPPDWPIDGVAGDILYGIANVLTQSPDLPASFPGTTGNEDGTAFLSPFAALAGGDLAPAVTTLPILVTAIAVATGIVVASTGGERRWPYAGLVALGGLAAGMMSASATWGLAIPAAITGSAIVIHLISTRAWDRPWPLARDIMLHLAAMLAIAVIAFLPFRAGYVVTERNAVTGELLTIRELVITAGGFLLFVVAYLVASATRVLDGARQEGLAGRITAAATIAIAVAGTLAGMWLDSAAVLLMTVLLLVIIAAWHRMEQPVHLLLLALAAVAAGIMVAGPLVPMPAGPFGESPAPEMTAAVWVILALAAAVIIAWLVDRLGTPGHRLHALAGSVLVTGSTILLVGMLAAPVMTTSVLTGSATTTDLDATAFLETTDDPQASAADRAAAQWLMDTIEGTPVILEAPGWDHQYGGRISAMTGLPAVIGWTTPERFTRPGWEQLATQRQEAARRIYESLGTFEGIEPLLRQYDVRLIYVGPLERAAYDDMALAKFERAAESGRLDVIYEADGVVIYEYPGSGAGREEGRP